MLNAAVISCNHSDDSGAKGPSQMACLEPQFLLEGLLSKGIIDSIQASHAMLDAISKKYLITPQQLGDRSICRNNTNRACCSAFSDMQFLLIHDVSTGTVPRIW